MSNNLTPKTIVDKNGVTTTRLVRMDSSPENYGFRKIPAPPGAAELTKSTPEDSTKHKGYLADLGEQRLMKVEVGDWRGDADKELVEVCSTKFNPETRYQCSGAEIYDIMSTVDAADIMPLLAVGVRTGEEAQHFLKENGLSRLIMDRSDQVHDRIKEEMDPFFTLDHIPGVPSGKSRFGGLPSTPKTKLPSRPSDRSWKTALSGAFGFPLR